MDLLSRISTQVHDSRLNDFQKQEIIAQINQGITGLGHARSIQNNEDEPALTPEYPGRYYPSSWQQIINDEISQFNSHGPAYITRVSECVIKFFALINIHHDASERSLTLFRGQHNAEWDIISSIGRTIPPEEVSDDKLVVSKYEITLLRTWQESVMCDAALQNEIFGSQGAYNLDDPRWWSIKQHYEGGTRLIDWTSSPLCALYFACVDWDGSINNSKNGAIYMLIRQPGRGFANKEIYDSLPEGEKGRVDCAGSSVANFFNLKKHECEIRSVIGEADSDRQLSQDGHYIFSTNFTRPMSEQLTQQPFFFVIPKEFKVRILRELYSIGYTPQKVLRGRKGKIAHKRLIEQLGIYE